MFKVGDVLRRLRERLSNMKTMQQEQERLTSDVMISEKETA